MTFPTAQVQRGGLRDPAAGEGPAGHPQDGAGAEDGTVQGVVDLLID